MKKVLSVLLTAVILMTLCIVLSVSAGAAESGDYAYKILDDGTAEITDYSGSASDLTIPGELNSYTVTSIGWRAFSDCTGLASVTIPDSVKSIDEGAFSGCTGLTSVTIGSSVMIIGDRAFSDCTGLTSLTIGSSVKSIGAYAFSHCTRLTNVTIPDSVLRIKQWAFSRCTRLTSVTIGSSVKTVGDRAFYGCTGLTGITIPDSVTSFGDRVFYGCTGLTSIKIAEGNTVYDSRDNCNAIIETATDTLVFGCKSTVIPDSVTSIGWYAFYGCKGLTSVIIPDSVTSIGWYAFYGCMGLKNVTILDSVTSIGNCAFYGCTGLTSITIPDSVTSIQSFAFYGCTGLTSVTIGNSVTIIGPSAFYGCTGLKSITIPDSVESVGALAFHGTAWYNNLPDGLVYIGKVAYKMIGICPAEVVIKDGTLEIADDALSHNSSLTGVTIPDSVTRIGNEAFYRCTGLTSITIPDSVTSIGKKAIGFSFNDPIDGFIIYGCSGSAAETYAKENGITFTEIEVKPPVDPDIILGDVDGDGKVTILDATAIQRKLANLPTKAYDEKAADTDGDGKVTILDATAIQRHLASLPTQAQGIGEPISDSRTDDEDFSYLNGKPSCPECGSDNVAYIMYGDPLPEEYYSAAFRRKLADGEIVFGGCVISPDSPKWHCNACGHGILLIECDKAAVSDK